MSGRGRGKRGTAKETNNETNVKEEKPKKTTKKKQFPVVAICGPDGIEGNLLPEQKRPLIVHLPIQSKDVMMNDMPIMYNPLPPTDAQPYDINADNPFYEGVEQFEIQNDSNLIIIPSDSKPIQSPKNDLKQEQPPITVEQEIDYYNLKSTLLIQYKDSAEVKSVPQTSDAACFWCCHSFTNRPVVLPIRDTGEHLQVMGNFCSPECACAYLFDMRQDTYTMGTTRITLSCLWRSM